MWSLEAAVADSNMVSGHQLLLVHDGWVGALWWRHVVVVGGAQLKKQVI
jgi:hypothetical protein